MTRLGNANCWEKTWLRDISSPDRYLSHICLSLPPHRCYTAVCSEKEKTTPPVPPRGVTCLGKITFTHEVLMWCLWAGVCVCRQKRWEDKERERMSLTKGKAQTRNRKWQDWKLGALGGHQRLWWRGRRVCVCVWRGAGTLSSGCTQTVCVFDVDLIQLLESQTQSVHPDVDRCAEYNPTSSETHTHTHTQRGGSNTYPSCAPSRDSLPGLHETLNKFHNIS